MLSSAHRGLTGSFGALLVGWLVVAARGLYIARHLFTFLSSDDLLSFSKILVLGLKGYIYEMLLCYQS